MRLYKASASGLFVTTGTLLTFFPKTEDILFAKDFLLTGPALNGVYGVAFLLTGAGLAATIRWPEYTRIVFTVALCLGLTWFLISLLVAIQFDSDAERCIGWAFFCVVQMRAMLVWQSRAFQSTHETEFVRVLQARRHAG